MIDFCGFGKYVAKTPETNSVVAARLGISEQDIIDKSGVGCRYIAKDETAASMGEMALAEAMGDQWIDGIIVATFSGDYRYPSLASRISKRLGFSGFAFDVQANCAGFQVALSTARDMLLANPQYQRIGVVGVAKQSSFIDPLDPETAYFFGDAASAVVVKRTVLGFLPENAPGLYPTTFKTTGKNHEAVRMRGGGSSYPDMSPRFEHAGLAVWKEVTVELPNLIKQTMKSMGWDDVDLVLMHQGNLRLIEFVMYQLRLPMSKTVTNIQTIGNTGDASLGTVLYDARDRLKGRVILASMGAGFVYAVTPYIGQ